MVHFLLGCAVGAAVAACIAAPLLLPWPVRVRYLVNAQTVDPLLGLGPIPRLNLRAVTVASVVVDNGRVDLTLEEVDVVRATVLSREGCLPSDVARLDGWSAVDTPLLMIVDEEADAAGRVHVYGPDGSVTGFTRAAIRAR